VNYPQLLGALQEAAGEQSELLRNLLPEDLFQLMLMHQAQNPGREAGPLNLNDPSHINPDAMSYEQLLQLEEQMGKVTKGLTPAELQVTLLRAFDRASPNNDTPFLRAQTSLRSRYR
jgi:hypothetical protein